MQNPSDSAHHLQRIHSDGYTVIEGLLSAGSLARIREQLAPFLQQRLFGRNDFEGFRSERVYALLPKAPAVAELVEHPRVLELADALLQPHYLLSAALAIHVHPGETPQAWHIDDAAGSNGHPAFARPRAPYGVSAIWALDDFTATNGATEVVPGSHLWQTDRAPRSDEVRQVLMPAGSVVVFAGNLLHRGGANRGSTSRLAITPQYCQPWLRQIENMVLAVPPAAAQRFGPRIRALLGYDIVEPGFMGYVDGRHPARLIDAPDTARGLPPSPGIPQPPERV